MTDRPIDQPTDLPGHSEFYTSSNTKKLMKTRFCETLCTFIHTNTHTNHSRWCIWKLILVGGVFVLCEDYETDTFPLYPSPHSHQLYSTPSPLHFSSLHSISNVTLFQLFLYFSLSLSPNPCCPSFPSSQPSKQTEKEQNNYFKTNYWF